MFVDGGQSMTRPSLGIALLLELCGGCTKSRSGKECPSVIITQWDNMSLRMCNIMRGFVYNIQNPLTMFSILTTLRGRLFLLITKNFIFPILQTVLQKSFTLGKKMKVDLRFYPFVNHIENTPSYW